MDSNRLHNLLHTRFHHRKTSMKIFCCLKIFDLSYMAREDIDLRSHVNSEMDEELSKAFVNFLIGTSGLVVCKNKFFKSCSKEVKERNQIIENLFGFSTPLTIEEAVAKTRSNIRILTEFTKKISTKYRSYITNFESKINDMSKFYFDRKDLIDSE